MRRTRAIVAVATVIGGFAAIGGAPASAAEPGCSLTPTNGMVTRTLGSRTYDVVVPAGLAASEVPLLVTLHGAGSNPTVDEYSKQWAPFAAAHGFIVAYPQARGFPQSGVWDPYSASSPDVGFLREVVADVSARWCVDAHRVYVDGWSNGAVMSQRMACSAADLFAAATSYGGGTPTVSGFATPCQPSRPISVGLFAGQFDFTYAGLAQNTAEWEAIDACASPPAHTTDAYGATDTYACAGGAQVLSRVVSNTSHNWPSGAQGEDQRARMWAFLTAHPLP